MAYRYCLWVGRCRAYSDSEKGLIQHKLNLEILCRAWVATTTVGFKGASTRVESIWRLWNSKSVSSWVEDTVSGLRWFKVALVSIGQLWSTHIQLVYCASPREIDVGRSVTWAIAMHGWSLVETELATYCSTYLTRSSWFSVLLDITSIVAGFSNWDMTSLDRYRSVWGPLNRNIYMCSCLSLSELLSCNDYIL